MNSSKRLRSFVIVGLLGIFVSVGYGVMANGEDSQPNSGTTSQSNDDDNTMRTNCIAAGGSLFFDKETSLYKCNLGS